MTRRKLTNLAGRLLLSFSLEDRPQSRILWPLFLVSFASLYLEILLIRWIGTEVRVFAYFQNLALIACFLGFGLGCYQSARKKGYLFEAVALGILVVLVEIPLSQWKVMLEELSSALALSPDAAIWAALAQTTPGSIAGPFVISVLLMSSLLFLVVATMVPLGQWVGTYLDAAKNPVTAYSANLLGSLAGIWLFAVMSFHRLSPVFWFGFAFLLYVLIRDPAWRLVSPGTLLLGGSLVLLLCAGFGNRETRWSPYQKLEVEDKGDQQFYIFVNNTGYLTIANLSPDYLARHPDVARDYRDSSYYAPFRLVGQRDRVLIVGAGAGNDVAAALRNGAHNVDAVEIDPVIYSLGERSHPEHPYDSPDVHVILNDARAYLRQCTKKYDVIIFGLLDSHTQFSGYSNMRIDNYVYTEESLEEAKRLLTPSGVLIVKFGVRAPWTWMGQRFYAMFDHLFGRPPVVFYAPEIGAMPSATVFLASNDVSAWDRTAQPELADMIKKNPPPFPLELDRTISPTTDDWPYVYHRGHTIPRAYLTISLILLAIALLATRRALEPAKLSTWYFFFLGAGFLLLETQLISMLALYFGATWLVNCVALSGILAALVLANFFVERGAARRLGPWYAVLVVSLLAIYFIPWESLPFGTRALGTLLAAAYCVPVFFAGVIFTETFRRSDNKSRAFGSNIVGAVAGGLAQNASFVIGLKALLLLAAMFYSLAGILVALGKARARQKESAALPIPTL